MEHKFPGDLWTHPSRAVTIKDQIYGCIVEGMTLFVLIEKKIQTILSKCFGVFNMVKV